MQVFNTGKPVSFPLPRHRMGNFGELKEKKNHPNKGVKSKANIQASF